MPRYLIDLGETVRIGHNMLRYIGPFNTQAEAYAVLKEAREKWAIPPTQPNLSELFEWK